MYYFYNTNMILIVTTTWSGLPNYDTNMYYAIIYDCVCSWFKAFDTSSDTVGTTGHNSYWPHCRVRQLRTRICKLFSEKILFLTKLKCQNDKLIC